jgi:carbon storage regulator
MLCLSRRLGERIYIGDGIVIKVIRISDKQVGLGIEAPLGTPILREELLSAGPQPATRKSAEGGVR